MSYKKILLITLGILCPHLALSATTLAKTSTYAQGQGLYDQYPWAATYYYGVTVNNPLVEVVILNNLNRWPEHIQSIELTRTLAPDNIVRRFFSPVVGIVQIDANITMRNGSNQHTIYEFNPYFNIRWANLPWNQYVNTSFAIGEGLSYDTSVSYIEKRNNDNTKRLLNYLMLEATFAAPSYPRLQLVARIHHRSGAYGLYHAGNTGSNDIGLAIRYLFD